MRIAITGANSSVGKNFLSHISEHGNIDVVAGVRSEQAFVDLPASPQIRPRIINYDNVADLTEALDGVDCVVHLAGILIENKYSNYTSANVAATSAVASAARQAGVEHIVFVSVIGADIDSPNGYFSSKGEAEKIITESGISATIIRTPILLGPDTAGAASLIWAASQKKTKLLGGGNNTMRPLDVDDLSLAILNSCKTRSEGATVYELVGPESILYCKLIKQVASMMGKEVSIETVPVWLAKIGAAIKSRIKGGGISPTVIDVITMDEIVNQNPSDVLGVTMTPLQKTLEKILANKK
ncbi:MAG: NAD(P)H-binding protein [Gammaproteobacteria bacterium]|nr:NAD(P)H-binding protein [Gammaproteobacteria bacterium]